MKRIIMLSSIAALILLAGCEGFLDRKSENIISEEQVFSDQNMINSVLANYYGRITWGPGITDWNAFPWYDEGARSSGGTDELNGYNNEVWRVYDYTLIRNLNQFLRGIKSNAASELTPALRSQLEGETRFIRAWTYFNMCKGMGGMPIVGDEVFEYKGGMDITALQYPRSTEAALYDYIISECTEAAALLPTEPTINGARANKWAALMLKARAAIYAGSIAKYNSKTPDVKTDGGEVGIPASRANDYYQIAYDVCQTIINEGPYELYDVNPDKGANFYEAVSSKNNNKEVIWTRDYKYPGQTTGFTNQNIANSVQSDPDANAVTPTLNLVEAFEYINERDGTLRTTNPDGTYIYYDRPEDLFKGKDPRLYGTVIYPGSDFNTIPMTYQAGQKYIDKDGKWAEEIGVIGSFDKDGDIITAKNGPNKSGAQYENNTGFNIRKFISYNSDEGTRGRGSDMWFIYFRYAETLMIAAEAALELGKPQTEVCGYINSIRTRAGIQTLSNVTLLDIEKERRVEFAYEGGHRWWDLKRWRRSHEVFNGVDSETAISPANHWALFPYVIKDATHPENGKWVFDKLRSTWTTKYSRNFEYRNYYNFINQDWINNNPKLVKNPYQ